MTERTWDEGTLATLRSLWAEGLSTLEIGRRMGVSKNSIVSKSHRLGLPSRPSPIRRDGVRKPQPERRPIAKVVGPTLPPMAPLTAPPVLASGPWVERPKAASPLVVPRLVPARITPCCFPIGEPGTREFHFCDAESLPGKAYCDEHHKRCVVKARVREDVEPSAGPNRFSFERHLPAGDD